MIKPSTGRPTQVYTVAKDSRLWQMVEAYYRHGTIGSPTTDMWGIFSTKRSRRHAVLADKIHAHMCWFVNKKIPYADNWKIQKQPNKWPNYELRFTVDLDKIAKLEESITDFKRTLAILSVGSCNCLTKTPEIKFHSESCRTRIIGECLQRNSDDS